MKLVLIEGPGKRDSIKKYLGAGYEVFATKGHIRDLPQSKFVLIYCMATSLVMKLWQLSVQ